MECVIVLSSLDMLIIFVIMSASNVVSNLQKPPRFMLQFKTTKKKDNMCVLKLDPCPHGKIFCMLARNNFPHHKNYSHMVGTYS
jgi:hypothetical protein